MAIKQKYVVVSAQVPVEVEKVLQEKAGLELVQRSEIVRKAIYAYLGITNIGEFVRSEQAKQVS